MNGDPLAFSPWEILRDHVPRHSRAYYSLEYTTPIKTGKVSQPDVSVRCDFETAKTILESARKWCPDAVAVITIHMIAVLGEKINRPVS